MLLLRKDHEGGDFKIKLNYDQGCERFVLSHIQGPVINTGSNVGERQLWQQYVRRFTAYMCTVFDPLNPTLFSSQEDAEADDTQWLRKYNHVMKISGINELGYYMNTEAMIVLTGLNNPNEFSEKIVEKARETSSEIGCKPTDQPWLRPKQANLAGHAGGGTTIVMTDLVYRVATASKSSEDLFAGLADLGWDTNVINIELGDDTVMEPFTSAVDKVLKILKEKEDDQSTVTVHVWLSMAFALRVKPPYISLINEKIVKECVEQLIRLMMHLLDRSSHVSTTVTPSLV